jgi:hypothetical protein
MGRFSQLPKDVIWLVFKTFIKIHPQYEYVTAWSNYECGDGCVNRFNWIISRILRELALISKTCLTVVKSKCYTIENGWLFKKGVMSK